jgi:hypothetical protein
MSNSLAKDLLGLTTVQLAAAVREGFVMEVRT